MRTNTSGFPEEGVIASPPVALTMSIILTVAATIVSLALRRH